MYPIKVPILVQSFYPQYLWKMPVLNGEKKLYLTFDDGPYPDITNWVLKTLKDYEAKATFFCIGKHVQEQADIYEAILSQGHQTGNHSFNHLNGWHTEDHTYIDNIKQCAAYVDSHLYRPPYLKINRKQAKTLKALSLSKSQAHQKTKIVMGTVISWDFDRNVSPEKCLAYVIDKAQSGDIVIFHDSAKAFKRMKYALPRVLAHFSARGFSFECLG